MYITRRRVNPRPASARRHTPFIPLRLVLFLLITPLLTLGSWLPATAQTIVSDPNTVVLPPIQMHLPLAYGEGEGVADCPTISSNRYETTPILGNPRSADVPPLFDPDLNLTRRGYKPIVSLLDLVAINGPTDDDAPQLAHLFRPVRVPTFRAVYQVYDWNWACCPGGALGQPITEPEVTLVEMETIPGELLYPPQRNANISRDFVAMVLYAEKFRITFTYTRDDSPAFGYVVHIDNFCVDPMLLALYEEMHAAGRDDLPALRRSDSLGIASSHSIFVAVRDTGSFMDPRSGKDWWQETVRALLAAQGAAIEE